MWSLASSYTSNDYCSIELGPNYFLQNWFLYFKIMPLTFFAYNGTRVFELLLYRKQIRVSCMTVMKRSQPTTIELQQLDMNMRNHKLPLFHNSENDSPDAQNIVLCRVELSETGSNIKNRKLCPRVPDLDIDLEKGLITLQELSGLRAQKKQGYFKYHSGLKPKWYIKYSCSFSSQIRL